MPHGAAPRSIRCTLQSAGQRLGNDDHGSKPGRTVTFSPLHTRRRARAGTGTVSVARTRTTAPPLGLRLAPPLVRPLLAALIVLVGAVASVGFAGGAPPAARAANLAPVPPVTSPTRASSIGTASTTALPPRIS